MKKDEFNRGKYVIISEDKDGEDSYDVRLKKAVAIHKELTGTEPSGPRLISISKRIKKNLKEEGGEFK